MCTNVLTLARSGDQRLEPHHPPTASPAANANSTSANASGTRHSNTADADASGTSHTDAATNSANTDASGSTNSANHSAAGSACPDASGSTNADTPCPRDSDTAGARDPDAAGARDSAAASGSSDTNATGSSRTAAGPGTCGELRSERQATGSVPRRQGMPGLRESAWPCPSPSPCPPLHPDCEKCFVNSPALCAPASRRAHARMSLATQPTVLEAASATRAARPPQARRLCMWRTEGPKTQGLRH